jgi:hypothetical protein
MVAGYDHLQKKYQFELFQRDITSKLLSFVLCQFPLLQFRGLLRYWWCPTKYVTVRPHAFETPAQFCLYETTIGFEVLKALTKKITIFFYVTL